MTQLTHVDLFAGVGGFSLALERAGAKSVANVEIDKYCRQILGRHFPSAKQFDDIKNVSGDDLRSAGFIPERGIITGGFPCFTAGTPVLTSRGYQPIESVIVGDLVLTHENRWRRVTDTMNRPVSEVVEFSPGFYATPEHRVLSRAPGRQWMNEIRQYRRTLGEASWREAQDLGGTFVAHPLSIPAFDDDTPKPPCGLTWWQVGRWVADGHTHSGTRDPIVSLGYAKVNRDLSQFGGDWKLTREKTALKLRLSSGREAGEWLRRHFGYLAVNKTIPAWAFSMSEDDRQELLDGYWSGDGHSTPSGVRSTSVSPTLTAGIATLAESLDYTVSIFHVETAPTTEIEGRVVNQANYWQLHAIPDDGRYTAVDGDWRWVKIRKNPKRIEGDFRVFDLTVEEDHSFVASGIAVHNCQDISIAGKGAGLSGDRSGLFWEIVRLLEELHPKWFILENVPRLLSINGGRDMATVVKALVDCGYGLAWRVLDAQHFGVPQRRRRVFIVGHLGGTGRTSAEILFEREGGSGDFAQGGEAEPQATGGAGDGAECGSEPLIKIDTHTHTHTHCEHAPGWRESGLSDRRGSGGGRTTDRVNALTVSGLIYGADENSAQAGHLIVSDTRGNART